MKLNFFTIAILSLFLLVSCKKVVPSPNPTPAQNEVDARIAIKLNTGYVTPSKIDSAVLVWEIGGETRTASLHLSNDTLYAVTKDFRKGTGRLTVQIFSSVKLRNQSLQYEKRMEVTLKEKQSINWAAPVSYEDLGWNPRVILIDPNSKLTAIIALRPSDPYFFLKNIPTGFKIELERIYTRIPGGAEIVASGTWKCNNVCTDARGIIENREFFLPLAGVGGREWKGLETGVGLFGPNGSSGGVLYFNHY